MAAAHDLGLYSASPYGPILLTFARSKWVNNHNLRLHLCFQRRLCYERIYFESLKAFMKKCAKFRKNLFCLAVNAADAIFLLLYIHGPYDFPPCSYSINKSVSIYIYIYIYIFIN
jgi:hypothetical protein